MTTFNLPATLTVEVTDVGIVTIETAAWSDEFILSALRYACRIKIDQKRNAPHETEGKKREAIAEAIANLNKGEWSQRATVAAKLDGVEKELRALLSAEFVKAGVKKSQADEYSRLATRWDTFRDLVVKPLIAKLATSDLERQQLMEKLEDRTAAYRHTIEQHAANRYAAIEAALKGMEFQLG